MKKRLIFTIDVEEWHHADNIRPYLNPNQTFNFSTLNYCDDILDFLNKRKIHGTFFFLASVAKEHPALIRKVIEQGHEVASHGLNHKLLQNMTASEVMYDISESTKILEDVCGEKIIGYRSPCFSNSEYLVDALLENGYEYTSMSIKASFHDRYADNSMENSSVKDYAISNVNILSLNFIPTGGGWFRLFPINMQNYFISKLDEDIIIFYCHPWDFGKNLPNQKLEIPFLKKVRHTINVDNPFNKLDQLEFIDLTLRDYHRSDI